VTGSPRPWLAGVLALLYPGLGHVYQRDWSRALLWFSLSLVTAMVLLPIPEGGGLDAALATVRNAPLTARVAIAAVTVLNAIDAYRLARQPTGGPTCEACGKDLDDALDFCPWCSHERS